MSDLAVSRQFRSADPAAFAFLVSSYIPEVSAPTQWLPLAPFQYLAHVAGIYPEDVVCILWYKSSWHCSGVLPALTDPDV